jgi:hypothetical protein
MICLESHTVNDRVESPELVSLGEPPFRELGFQTCEGTIAESSKDLVKYGFQTYSRPPE